MSTYNKMESNWLKWLSDKSKIAQKSLIFLVIIILAIAGVSYYLGKKEGAREKSPIPIINVAKNSHLNILGANVISWSGKITQIEKSKIIFLAKSTDQQGKATEKEYTAKYSADETEFLKWDLTKPASAGSQSNQENIKPDQLQTGQTILVKSTKNADKNGQIEAESVSWLVTPTSK